MAVEARWPSSDSLTTDRIGRRYASLLNRIVRLGKRQSWLSKGREPVHVIDQFDFIGNLVVLVALCWITAYELWWNPRQFRAALARSMPPLEAARLKRSRGDRATLAVFVALAVSYGAFLMGGISMGPQLDLETRVKKLEDEVFGPNGPRGGYGHRLESIEARLDTLQKDLESKIAVVNMEQRKSLRDLIEIVAELRKEVGRLQSGRTKTMGG
jgi:hypothetical protein